jgi:WD40 repeat protein
VYKVAVHPSDPTLILSGSGDDSAMLWHATSGARLLTLAGHADSVVDVAFNADGSLAATASLDGSVAVYRTQGRGGQEGAVYVQRA